MTSDSEPDESQEDEPLDGRKRAAVGLGEEDNEGRNETIQKISSLTRRERIEQSIKQVMKTLIEKEALGISKLCTKESVRAMIDILDDLSTRKVKRRMKAEGPNSGKSKGSSGTDIGGGILAPEDDEDG